MRPEGAEPSVLLFDFGGTLDSDGIPWKERFFRLFREEGVSVAPEVFDVAFYAADDALVGRIPREFTLEDVVERLARDVAEDLAGEETVASARAAKGTANARPAKRSVRDVAPRVAARFVAEAKQHVSKNLPVISDLAARYSLGIVSNFYGNLEAVCVGAGLAPHFGAMVDSAVVGFEKPDERIFLAALSALDATPAEAVFVGDSLRRDMAGARDLGMPHVWLAAGGGVGCCPGDRVIRRLAELPEMFL